MALSNHDRVGKALDLVRDGLQPFIIRELKQLHGDRWFSTVTNVLSDAQEQHAGTAERPTFDAGIVLTLLWNLWNLVFNRTLGQSERTLVSELREVRNRWAHPTPQRTFSSDDAYRALDSAHRLLLAVSAPEADELERMKLELLRVRYDEQVRSEKRRTAGTLIESPAAATLKPWREVVTPHRDVASGHYQQAEFAADLYQVHIGEGTDEYRRPDEFFRRTYLTESLRALLVGAARRLTHGGGDPVVQLQTNFGGGKTHSMLALYHLCSGTPPGELLGIDGVLANAGVAALPPVRRVVLVGNKISPGNPVTKPDGTVVRTLWGELAWQLGGRAAFERVRQDDEHATSPGDVLRELFNEYAPCLLLIDEWVAYARQLHESGDLPGGTFETHFTFAQALTEAARGARQCLLVISLPASDTQGSPHTQADDVEVGGARGRAALDRLRNAVGRLEASWRPASAEEGFEIVRRRLFESLIEQAQFVARDTTARAFFDSYRTQHAEFPPECRDADYETRLKAAYPIHPEVFDRLYNDWSTLVKFQRTRGVLRLMAAVIHSLWQRGDRNPLILPATLPIDDPRVQFELTRYLSDNWVPVIEKDVDGASALPLRMDGEIPSLGQYGAARRVARTIYLGSAPTATAANVGIEERRVKLGCIMPGEATAVFGDALRRLGAAATYLYQDGSRYWYSTQPTVTKMAEDRAEHLKRDPDKVVKELDERLRANLRQVGDLSRVHPLPESGQDVPDDPEARLVVLGVAHPYSKDANNAAQAAAQAILESRGSTPRLYRNALVFLAVDKTRLQELDEAVRRYLAWQSIVDEKSPLNLTDFQARQAQTQRDGADLAVTARIPEAYQWLLVPTQETPQAPITWAATRLQGSDALAVRASKKLRNEGSLIAAFGPALLRMELDRVPLWRGNHVEVRQLADDFGRYLYLPRLKGPDVLHKAVAEGVGLLTWQLDGFAYADSYDEASGRYRGLRCGAVVQLEPGHPTGLVVKPAVAQAQLEAEAAARASTGAGGGTTAGTGGGTTPGDQTGGRGGTGSGPGGGAVTPPTKRLRRYQGSVVLDATRVGRDAGRIAEEVVAHLVGLVGARVTVTLDIAAEVPTGVPEHVVRTVTENGRALKFTNSGFEEE